VLDHERRSWPSAIESAFQAGTSVACATETAAKDGKNALDLSLIMRSEKLIAKLLSSSRDLTQPQGKAMGIRPHSIAALAAGAVLFSGEDSSSFDLRL
jgi:hypothetical protein